MFNLFNRHSNKKLSIILPVYNASKYLDICLDSVLSQTDREIEVIAIDDASDDNSYETLLNYRKHSPSLSVFKNKSNLGPGPTRNLGIKKAVGKYITFIDSDDFVSENYIQSLVHSAEANKSDIAFANVTPKLPKIEKLFNEHANGSVNMEDLPSNGIAAAWGKIYRKEFITKNKIHFVNKKIIIGEDVLFTWVSYFCARSISFAQDATYNYRNHKNGCDSICDERVLDIFKVLNELRTIYQNLDPSNSRKNLFIYIILNHITYNYFKLRNSANDNLINEFKYEAKLFLDYPDELISANPYLSEHQKHVYFAHIKP